MPVSGLIISLSNDKQAVQSLMQWLKIDSSIEVGQRHGNRLAIVLDTPSSEVDKSYWQEFQDHQGVMFVDVACVYFDQDDEQSCDENSDAHENQYALAADTQGITS